MTRMMIASTSKVSHAYKVAVDCRHYESVLVQVGFSDSLTRCFDKHNHSSLLDFHSATLPVKPAKKKATTEDDTKAIDTAAKAESPPRAKEEKHDGNEDAEDAGKNFVLDEDDDDSKDDSEQKDGLSTKRSTFPERLLELLTNGIAKDAMWWLPNGDSFAIQPKKFSDTILNKYFQGTKLESFTRKMNRW